MSDPYPLAAWCPNCGAVGPVDARWLDHPRGCLQPGLEQVDRLTVVRWRRERKRDGWYPEDVDWLVGEVERLRATIADIDELGWATIIVQRDRAQDEVERLRGLLARLEWIEQGYNCVDFSETCPICIAEKDAGHEPGCEWVAVMRPGTTNAPPRP